MTLTIPAVVDGSVLPPVDPSTRLDVTFDSDGHELAGHLYLPPSGGGPFPALAMSGPMTSVKEETLPQYASVLARAGFAVLAFDHRGFGGSGGDRRQHIETGAQIQDLQNAVTYLGTRDEADPARIGLAAVCLGAGYAVRVAAMDRRVKALALVGGGYNFFEAYREFFGAEGFAGFLDMVGEARRTAYLKGEPQYLPAIAGAPDYGPAAMPIREAFEYYDRAHRTHAPAWRNELSVESLEQIAALNVVPYAPGIHQPTVVVHGTVDVLLPPRFAKELHDNLGAADKELHWIETHNHVELYDQAPYVPAALDAIVPFLVRHLAAR